MYASQLLRILKTFPTHVNNEICAFDTDELKETMKESPGRYRNPFLSDEENDNDSFWNTPELERSIDMNDFTDNIEDEKFRRSLASCDVASEFFEKATEFYTDKNVMECDLPELVVCYKESGYHVVKDICVDEGIPDEQKIVIDEDDYKVLCNSISVNGDRHFGKTESSLDNRLLDHERLRSSSRGDSDLPIPDPDNVPRDIGDKHDNMIEGNIDAQFLNQERLRCSSTEDCYMDANLSFVTKEKVDTVLFNPEPLNDHNDMGKICTGMEISIQDGQNSSERKDCEENTKECGTKEKVPIHSVISNEAKNLSEDDSNDGGTSKCILDGLKLSLGSNTVQCSAVNCGLDKKMQTGAGKPSSSAILLDGVSTKQLDSDSKPSMQQDRPLTSLKFLFDSSNNGVNDVDQQPSQRPVEEISERPIVGSEVGELGRSGQTAYISNESKMEGTINSKFDPEKPASSSGHSGAVNPEVVHDVNLETRSASNLGDMASDNVTMANRLGRGEGESSFSVAGPPSGLITCLEPISYSGSISIRSDSSTTSTRSFAFPVLQTEWNSSPVRMAKADRSRLRKHRGWRHGLLCCRF